MPPVPSKIPERTAGFTLVSLVLAGFGLIFFLILTRWQQQWDTRMEAIRSGTVVPTTLQVARRCVNDSRRGWSYSLVYTNAGKPEEIHRKVSRQIYEKSRVGDATPGYEFPNGYLIPSRDNGNFAGARATSLFIASSGFLTQAGFRLWRRRRSSGEKRQAVKLISR